MAKLLYACSRRASFGNAGETLLRQLCARLEPDNLRQPVPHQIFVKDRLAWAVVNCRSATVAGDSVLLGCLYGSADGWDKPRQPPPDGSFALVRHDHQHVEAVSDAAGSRTLWYFFDEEQFIVSTSQRAIVMFLGSVDFNPQVIPWMLSTGSLGPDASWDRRIRRLPADASVLLDKQRWSISVDERPIVFSAASRSRDAHKETLREAIRATVRSLKASPRFSFDDYALPLSGGYDSRGILCFLAEGGAPEKLRAITWGLELSRHRQGNDASVAIALAARMGVKHRYYAADAAPPPMAEAVGRFVHCGEGRVDHLSAYVDGLETWRALLEEEGCKGIIRGDEGFGWIPVSSELTVRFNVGMALCADYRNLDGVLERFGLPEQHLPAALQRRRKESLSTWRDRLYHAYRLPTILAALSDLKYSYVEIVNPLLARSVLGRVRELPDALRTNKALFKEIVDAIGPDVPYATEQANVDLLRIVRDRELVKLMRSAFRAGSAEHLFPREFLDDVLYGLHVQAVAAADERLRAWRRVKSFVPRSLKNWVRDRVAKPALDGNVLAFRVFLVLRMHEVLQSDANAIERSPEACARAA